jgi:hypothetical protein
MEEEELELMQMKHQKRYHKGVELRVVIKRRPKRML